MVVSGVVDVVAVKTAFSFVWFPVVSLVILRAQYAPTCAIMRCMTRIEKYAQKSAVVP